METISAKHAMNNHDSDGAGRRLTELLRRWEVISELPSDFRREVWQRVERSREEESSTISGWLWSRLGLELVRPAVAVAYLTILIAAGSVLGWSRAEHQKIHLKESLGERYVQSIDPYHRLR